jgi:hypothetical protein
MIKSYAEDHLVGRPAIGLIAKQSALPDPRPSLSGTLPPVGEVPVDEGAQPPGAITADVYKLVLLLSSLWRLPGAVNLKLN